MAADYQRDLGRVLLRDFVEQDRAAFLEMYAQPAFRKRVGLTADEAAKLFATFLEWKESSVRTHVQLAIVEPHGRLIGDVGIRADKGEAAIGIDLHPKHWGRHRLAIDCLSAAIDIARELGARRVNAETHAEDHVTARIAKWLGAEEISSGNPYTRLWVAEI